MVTFISGVWNNLTKKIIHIVDSDAAPPEDVKTRENENSSTTNTQSGSRHTSDSDSDSDSDHLARHDTAARDVHRDTEVPSANKSEESTQIATQDKSNDNHSKLPSALSSNLTAARYDTESHSETRKCTYWTDVEDALLRTLYETHGTQ